MTGGSSGRLWRRLARALLVAPFWLAGLIGRRGPAIVLLYHGVDDPAPDGVSARSLRAHAALIRRRRRRPATFGGLVAALRGREGPAPDTVVVTFDDGHLRAGRAAGGVLARRGIATTIFALPALATGARLLSEAELRALADRGVEIGAHGVAHVRLTALDPEPRRRDIAGSRAFVARATGKPASVFAYPYGAYDRAVADDVRAAGFDGACTTEPRPVWAGDDPFAVPRVVVGDFFNLLEVEVLLSGAAAAYLAARRVALGLLRRVVASTSS